MGRTILVVDDEEKIRASLRAVLSDEGFEVLEAADGRAALELIERRRPDLAIVDIWMPEVDGVELVQRLRGSAPGLPVIVISGHGTVEMVVRVLGLGAVDFLEKPFTLETLLASVERALGGAQKDRDVGTAAVVAGNGPCRRSQRTIKRSVVVNGQGLHTGIRTGLILQPAPPGTGILFASITRGETVPALVEHVESTGHATTLRRGAMVARTVEHLLATLHAYGITNVLVKMQGEVPILDGSARGLCELVEEAGVQEQPETIEEVAVDDRYVVGSLAPGKKGIAIEPAEEFSVHYTLEYPAPIGHQEYTFHLRGPEAFRQEIAPARTFAFVREIEALEARGLATGGRLSNCLLVGETGVVNAPLRFPDEFVRHKILDICGDFYLLGRPLRGRVTAQMTGHADNVTLLRLLRERIAPAAPEPEVVASRQAG